MLSKAILVILAFVHAAVAAEGPCDIYKSGGTPCVAAHSTTRALYGAYSGHLYQVQRQSDKKTAEVGVLSAGGMANSSIQDEFCKGAQCVISIIYDQSEKGNHLRQAPPGYWKGPEPGGYDKMAVATAAPIKVDGHKVYGVFISQGTGYCNRKAVGTAKNDEPEGMYAVVDGTHYNEWCCFDYGNAEVSGTDTGNGHMEAIYFGTSTQFGTCSGKGPWLLADMENGLYSGVNTTKHSGPDCPTIHDRFVTGMLKGKPNNFALRGGNAASGPLSTHWDGARPNKPGFNPMKKEGAIILGTGGDNSNSGQGTFYEGAMTSGYPTEATENAIQANIVAAKYTL